MRPLRHFKHRWIIICQKINKRNKKNPHAPLYFKKMLEAPKIKVKNNNKNLPFGSLKKQYEEAQNKPKKWLFQLISKTN